MEPLIQTRVHRTYQKLYYLGQLGVTLALCIFTPESIITAMSLAGTDLMSRMVPVARITKETLYQGFVLGSTIVRSMLLADRFSVSLSLRLSRWC